MACLKLWLLPGPRLSVSLGGGASAELGVFASLLSSSINCLPPESLTPSVTPRSCCTYIRLRTLLPAVHPKLLFHYMIQWLLGHAVMQQEPHSVFWRSEFSNYSVRYTTPLRRRTGRSFSSLLVCFEVGGNFKDVSGMKKKEEEKKQEIGCAGWK